MWPFRAPRLEHLDFSVARPGDTVILRPKSSWGKEMHETFFREMGAIAKARGLQIVVLPQVSFEAYVLRASGKAE